MKYVIRQTDDGWAICRAKRFGRYELIREVPLLADVVEKLVPLLDDEAEEEAFKPKDGKPKGVTGHPNGEAWEMGLGMIKELEKRTKERDDLLTLLEGTIVSLTKKFTDVARKAPGITTVKVAVGEVVKVQAEPEKAPTSTALVASHKTSSPTGSSSSSYMSKEQRERLEKKRAELKAKIAKAKETEQ